MASAARDRLGKALRGDAEPASSTDLTVRMDALTLDVEGFGRARFPVTPAKARKLVTLGKPARFGRGEDTLTDPGVRDTWEIPVGLVSATWDPGVLRDVLDTVKEDLGLPNSAELDVDLHSLLVYEPNQFFLKHQDTEKTDEMIGTLVVTLRSWPSGSGGSPGHRTWRLPARGGPQASCWRGRRPGGPIGRPPRRERGMKPGHGGRRSRPTPTSAAWSACPHVP